LGSATVHRKQHMGNMMLNEIKELELMEAHHEIGHKSEPK
jgi:hypothetical protein